MASARTLPPHRSATAVGALTAAFVLALACVSVSGLHIRPLALLQQASALKENCPEQSSALANRAALVDKAMSCHDFLDSAGTTWKVHGLKRDALGAMDQIDFGKEWVDDTSPDGCMVKCNQISDGKDVGAIQWKDSQPKQCNVVIFKMEGHMGCQFFTTKIATTEAWALPSHGKEDIAFRQEGGAGGGNNNHAAGGDGNNHNSAATTGSGAGSYEVPLNGGNLDITTTINIKP